MTPYHHYPRVGLQYCRCDHCGNDLRSRILSRLFDNRRKNMPIKPMSILLRKRRKMFTRNVLKSKRRVEPPAYKLRRESKISMQKKLEKWKNYAQQN